MPWNYRSYGTIDDPIHKSHLNDMTGEYGCLRRFRFDKDRAAEGIARDSDTECNGKATAGTATHECIARALSNRKVRALMLTPGNNWKVTADGCRKVFDEEMAAAVGDRTVHWYKDDPAEIADERSQMVAGVLNDMATHVRDVRFIEAGFIVEIGGYWCSGHTDLLYEPVSAPGTIALADWKTGAQRPNQIELDHSWESGIYSAAMHSGLWIEREHVELPIGTPNKYYRERTALESALIRAAKMLRETGELAPHVHRIGAFPSEIRYVHLADYPPYQRAGKKEATRPEELSYYRLDQPTTVRFTAGERRGPAWYRVRRTEQDIPRLETLLKNVVGTVRMGRFFESVSEKCGRCQHQLPCLNAGYEVRGDERVQLEAALKTIATDDDGLGNVA